MKLAALGVVTIGIGVVVDAPGLMGIGLFWVVMGLIARVHARKIKELQGQGSDAGVGGPTSMTTTVGAAAAGKQVVDGRTFAIGTLIWVGLGVPSLAVGLLEIGISAEDADWRWLPIVVGGLALAVGVLGAVLYLTGSAVLAVAENAEATIPATIWIRGMSETGTYINEKPRLEFELQVEPDPTTGVTSYEVSKKATVPFTAIGSLRIGDGFRAMVAGPDDPTSMEIRWDQPVTGDTGDGGDADDVSSRLEALDQLLRDAKITDEEYQAQRQRILGSL